MATITCGNNINEKCALLHDRDACVRARRPVCGFNIMRRVDFETVRPRILPSVRDIGGSNRLSSPVRQKALERISYVDMSTAHN